MSDPKETAVRATSKSAASNVKCRLNDAVLEIWQKLKLCQDLSADDMKTIIERHIGVCWECPALREPTPPVDPLRALIEKWRKPQDGCTENNHGNDCICPCFDDCADELEAALESRGSQAHGQ